MSVWRFLTFQNKFVAKTTICLLVLFRKLVSSIINSARQFVSELTASILILLLLNTYAISQLDRSFYQFDSKDGLNTTNLYGLVQDTQGFIWIGSSTGLIKYDGNIFTTISIDGLSNNEVLELTIDEDNNLWFLNLSNQLCKYSEKDGATILDLNERLAFNNIWINGNEVGVSNDLKKGMIINRTSPEVTELLTSGFRIPCLNSDIYITYDTISAVSILDKDQKKLIVNGESFLPKYLFKLAQDYYFIGTSRKSLGKISPIENDKYIAKFDSINKNPYFNNDISLLRDSNLYLSTSNGAYMIKNSALEPKQEFAKGFNITNCLLDHENNLWLSTMNNGLLFSHFSNISSFVGLEDYSIRKLIKGDSTILFGTDDGIFSSLNMDKRLIDTNLKYEPIRFILKYENKFIIGTNNIISLNDNNTFIDLNALYGCQKDAILLDSNKLFVSNCTGFIIYRINNDNSLTEIERHLTNRIFSIFHDKANHKVLFSTIEGINEYDYKNKKITYNILPELSHYNIIEIKLSSSGILWLASNTAGVFGVRDKIIVEHFTKDNLLNTDHINQIYLDGEHLWISTHSGINQIDLSTRKVTYITEHDGLNSNIVKNILIDKQKVYVATVKGVNVFDNNINFSNTTVPPVFMQNTVVDGKPNDLTELSGREQNFRFNFQGISYSSLGKFQYKYRLKGLSDAWEYIPGKINEAIYNKLSPGDYTFEVLTINEDGSESITPASISFHIPKPFYFRWWFVLFTILLSLFLIQQLFQSRIKRIKQRNELEMNVRSQQLIALKAQMKPHFISNVLNSIQSHSMLQDPVVVNQYITRLSKFVRKVLNMSDAQLVVLEEELDVIQTYIELEQLRSDQSFQYSITIDSGVDKKRFTLPPMLLQPYIENAIKHGISGKENGFLSIHIAKGAEDTIFVSIEDNGPGIHSTRHSNTNNNHISLGSKKNSHRINLLQDIYKKPFSVKIEDLSASNKDNLGTKVLIEISNISNDIHA